MNLDSEAWSIMFSTIGRILNAWFNDCVVGNSRYSQLKPSYGITWNNAEITLDLFCDQHLNTVHVMHA